ncbi:glycosyltransferase [Kaistella sp. 97-N-M2]|uniref:glycosyltransferase family 2 protein n=1 Tax=Kaistella sp. 97-N-M2 TaxID=2908645 RepID=UPI001F447A00|nr:glycosyltransferase [Kaistella sp. 97-N-M2]UJF30654.1 glycosyltransferase [Kaistella sp. 97-N-M2]
MDDLVSICIPTFNGEKYLQEALESVKAQTYKNIEVVISDDRSSDNTLNICEKFKAEVSFPVSILSHIPAGIGANWNNSINKARGKYIKILFQDDVLEANCIEEMLNCLLKNKLHIVVSKRNIIDEDSLQITTGDWFEKYKDLQKPAGLPESDLFILSRKNLRDLDVKVYSAENIIGEPCASLFSKRLFEEVGPFSECYKQILDYAYWLRTLARYDIGILGEKLVKFRYHPQQASAVNLSKDLDEGHVLENILLCKFLFDIDLKSVIFLLKKRMPFFVKVAQMRYKLFP